MKTAKLTVEAVCVLCPCCNEAIPNRANGSLMWAREDFTVEPIEIKCPSCDRMVKVVHRKNVKFN